MYKTVVKLLFLGKAFLMHKINKLFLLIFLICAGTLAYAYYSQYYQGVSPCPLCIAQRIVIAIIGLLSLIFSILGFYGFLNKLCSLIVAGFAIFGIKIAAHHIYLMNLPPDQQPLSCGMPLEVLYQKLPLTGFLHHILQGDAECGKVNWLVFGMSGPTAMIVLCSGILLLLIYNMFRKPRA
jgi:disulfide bond formation protein DsbB